MVLSAAGAVDHDALVKLAESHFGKLKAGTGASSKIATTGSSVKAKFTGSDLRARFDDVRRRGEEEEGNEKKR